MAKLDSMLVVHIPMYSNKRNNLLTVLTTVLLKWAKKTKCKMEEMGKKEKEEEPSNLYTHATFIDAIIHR